MAASYRCADCRDTPERCEDCRARRAAARTERRGQRRKARLCTECGRKPLRGQTRCAHHAAQNNALSLAGHVRAAKARAAAGVA